AMQSIATAFVSIACSDSIREFTCHVARNAHIRHSELQRAREAAACGVPSPAVSPPSLGSGVIIGPFQSIAVVAPQQTSTNAKVRRIACSQRRVVVDPVASPDG